MKIKDIKYGFILLIILLNLSLVCNESSSHFNFRKLEEQKNNELEHEIKTQSTSDEEVNNLSGNIIIRNTNIIEGYNPNDSEEKSIIPQTETKPEENTSSKHAKAIEDSKPSDLNVENSLNLNSVSAAVQDKVKTKQEIIKAAPLEEKNEVISTKSNHIKSPDIPKRTEASQKPCKDKKKINLLDIFRNKKITIKKREEAKQSDDITKI